MILKKSIKSSNKFLHWENYKTFTTHFYEDIDPLKFAGTNTELCIKNSKPKKPKELILNVKFTCYKRDNKKIILFSYVFIAFGKYNVQRLKRSLKDKT